MEIKEVFEEVKEKLGDKGVIIAIVGVAVLFFLVLSKQTKEEEEETKTVVQMVGFSAYPDAVTNANVIISSLQNSIDYAQGEIQEDIKEQNELNKEQFSNISEQLKESNESINENIRDVQSDIGDKHSEMQKFLSGHFTATQDYISEGLKSQYEMISHGMGELDNKLDSVTNLSNTANKKLDTLAEDMEFMQNIGMDTFNNVTSAKALIRGVGNKVTEIGNNVTSLDSKVNELGDSTSFIKDYIKDMEYKNSDEYLGTYKIGNYSITQKGDWDLDNSIVDNLKARGIDSSERFRSELAYQNGIVQTIGDYTGTYEQNVELMKKLKNNTLTLNRSELIYDYDFTNARI